MKFPIVDNSHTTSNPRVCTYCNGELPNDESDVWLMLGTMQGDTNFQSMGNEGELFGFFSISRHSGKSIEIVQNGLAGQADIGFCSSKCLRAFFNACVDELEDC